MSRERYTVTRSLYRNSHTQTLLAQAPDRGEVWLHVPLVVGAPGLAALQRERQVLELVGIGVRQVVPSGEGLDVPAALEVAAIPGRSLRALVNARLPVPTMLWIARALVRRLSQLHAGGVILKEVMPTNVQVELDSRRVDFISYSGASLLPRESVRLARPDHLEGPLQYIAPEQTGRVNASIDYRADFYGLGATLYEMTTGSPPFTNTDPVELVHAHIAKMPRAPALVAAVPAPLSDIILRLLAKSADDRYQSASALDRDLERCEQRLNGDDIDPFEVGRDDQPSLLRQPKDLHGREAELGALRALLERAKHGPARTVLLGGESGVGKSMLVQNLQLPVLDEGGSFVAGKFEQFRRSTPYFGLAQALRGLVRLLLSESEEQIGKWRKALSTALGNNARLMVDVIPELELIIGEQPTVSVLAPAEAERRFSNVITAFVEAIARRMRPLVLFLDDLHWADPASLELVGHLTRNAHSLLLVCAYRSDEVDAHHPLRTLLELARNGQEGFAALQLDPLSRSGVEKLVADALSTSPEQVADLAELVMRKTDGTPYFLLRFLESLNNAGLLNRHSATGRWRWDADEISRLPSTDNVVKLVSANIERLPAESQRALATAAHLGHSFDLDLLSRTAGWESQVTLRHLAECVRQGQLLPSTSEQSVSFQFVHDRVQQAAYALLPAGETRELHREIAHQLWRGRAPSELQEQIFDVCHHFRLCVDLLESREERVRVGELNLAAGRRAKASAAYELGRQFLATGIDSMSAVDGWENAYVLTRDLHRERAECEYLAGNFAVADELFDLLLLHARSDLDRVTIHTLKTRLAYHATKYENALDEALRGLLALGVAWPGRGDEALLAAIAEESAELERLLEGRKVEQLLDLPAMDNPRLEAETDLLQELSLVGMFFTPLIVSLATRRILRLSLQSGNSTASAPAYASYGMMIGSIGGQFETGFAFAEMAQKLARRQGARPAECQASYWLGAHVSPWTAHLEHSISTLKANVDLGLHIGAPVWAAYSAFHIPVNSLLGGKRLHEVSALLDRYLPPMEGNSRLAASAYRQLVKNLTGELPVRGDLSDEGFDEAHVVRAWNAPGQMLALMHYYMAKLMAHSVFGQSEAALRVMAEADAVGDMRVVLFAQFVNAPWFMYRGCALIDAIVEQRGDAAQHRAALDEIISDFTRRAELCPANFGHMRALLAAERARLGGNTLEAIVQFDRAAALAQTHGFLHDEALIHERNARFHRAEGRNSLAAEANRAALRCYGAWGARAKVIQLLQEHGDAHDASPVDPGSDAHVTRDIDLLSVLKSSRVLTSEVNLERLLEKTLTILLENAGAQRGCLLTLDHDEIRIEAQAETNEALVDGPAPSSDRGGGADRDVAFSVKTFTDDERPTASASHLLAIPIVQFALRTSEVIVLDDATASTQFGRTPYVMENKIRSVCCIPLMHQGAPMGAVYLENNLVRGAFHQQRVDTVKLIASHAVIAIQNARLFKSTRRFVPREFLSCLGERSLTGVRLGQNVSKTMSVLFSDIRDFTSIVETLPAEEHIGFINSYLSFMEPAIVGNQGFVDSYIGDAIMALFEGGPETAVRAGVAMSRGLMRYNEMRRARGEAEVSMGVGISTGPLTLGTIGASMRLKCGVIGDCVNLAARVQDLNKRYGSFLLISDTTLRDLSDPSEFTTRVVERVQVRGKQAPATLYEVLDADPRPEAQEGKRKTLAEYTRAVELYYRGAFAEAGRLFAHCTASCPEDVPARRMQANCLRYMSDPPAAGWSGVERLLSD